MSGCICAERNKNSCNEEHDLPLASISLISGSTERVRDTTELLLAVNIMFKIIRVEDFVTHHSFL